MGRLKADQVAGLAPGKHSDGDGLLLSVSPKGARSWILRFQIDGRRRDMGLGPFPEVSLTKARQLAIKARQQSAARVDPLEARRAAARAAKPIPTFEAVAEDYISIAAPSLKGARAEVFLRFYLGPYYCASILKRPVSEITSTDVEAILRPVWHTKPEAARKLYGALRKVFESARIRLKADHGVAFDNPATWQDLKAKGYSAPKALTRGHHPALCYNDAPAFWRALCERDGLGSMMLRFLLVTVARTGSARLATWDEIDFENAVWTIPIAHLKDSKSRKKPLRIPLSPPAIALLRKLEEVRQNEFVFPGTKRGEPISATAGLVLLRRMNAETDDPRWVERDDDGRVREIAPHGFRASFRTWAEEVVSYPHAAIELSMGHAIGGQVERAYNRTDLLEKRRELLNAWAQHVTGGAD